MFRRKTFLEKVFPFVFVGGKLLFKILDFMAIYSKRIELIPRSIAEKLV
jgi:hypothetical protein